MKIVRVVQQENIVLVAELEAVAAVPVALPANIRIISITGTPHVRLVPLVHLVSTAVIVRLSRLASASHARLANIKWMKEYLRDATIAPRVVWVTFGLFVGTESLGPAKYAQLDGTKQSLDSGILLALNAQQAPFVSMVYDNYAHVALTAVLLSPINVFNVLAVVMEISPERYHLFVLVRARQDTIAHREPQTSGVTRVQTAEVIVHPGHLHQFCSPGDTTVSRTVCHNFV